MIDRQTDGRMDWRIS